MSLSFNKTFKGGVHPEYNKELTSAKKIAQCSLPDNIVLPVSQHIGAYAEPVVQKGDEVTAGQVVAEAKANISSRILATVNGKVLAIEKRLHPVGSKILSIVIKTDKDNDKVIKMAPLKNPQRIEIIRRIRDAGIVGLGGAAFPTDVKLQPDKRHKIQTVIANGCECEPYLTSDHRQMLEEAAALIDGLKLVMKVLKAPKGVIAIEDNKKDAIEKLKNKLVNDSSISVMSLASKYPQGAADMLIKTVTGKEVPVGGRSTVTGAFVQNVGTLINISKAVRDGMPLIYRVVTVTGDLVKNPQNFRAPIGTPISHLINEAGGLTKTSGKVIIGGPMTGSAQFSFSAPILKATGGVVVMSKDNENASNGILNPCIRCSRCLDVCPMGLMPSTLSIYSEVRLWEKTDEYNVLDCIECSSCSFVCPSKRPIVQLIKFAKHKVKELSKTNG